MNCAYIAVALMTLCGSPIEEKIHLPPAKYDHPYTGKLKVKYYYTEASINRACMVDPPGVYGCAWFEDDVCHVAVLSRKIMGNRDFNRLMRHELGHCNGWSRDHEGERD